MQRHRRLLVNLALALCVTACAAGPIDWKWKTGRATYCGTDDWSIHKGSCGYGALWQDEPHGWDVAANTDFHEDYPDSCGVCYEIACDNAWVSDNYGKKLDRTYSCYDTAQSMVVRITDTCPCTYPANAYSNKRWCCGDMDHFDVSVWAFEKLTDKKWGVIGIKYRRVPCEHKPEKQAPAISNPSPLPSQPDWGQSRPRRDWPEYTVEQKRNYIFFDAIDGNWWDNSWNTWVRPTPTNPEKSYRDGMRGGRAYCGTIKNKGAICFKTNPGAFQDKYKLEFWVYVGVAGWEGTAARVPDIQVSIRGTKGQCNIIKIYDVKPDAFEPVCQYCADYYWRFVWYLPYFGGEWTHQVFNSPEQFKGCGGNTVWDLNEVQFRSDWGGDKWVCLDRIALV